MGQKSSAVLSFSCSFVYAGCMVSTKTDFVLIACYCIIIIIRWSINIARVEAAAPAPAPTAVCVPFANEIVSISFEIESFDCEQFS